MMADDKPRDISAVLTAMDQLAQMDLRYIPPWLRIDRDQPWEPEGDTHVLMRIGNRYYDCEGVAWPSMPR